MAKFFARVFRFLAVVVTAYAILFIGLFLILSLLATAFAPEPVQARKGSWLVLDLGMSLTEKPADADPFALLGESSGEAASNTIGFRALLEGLEEASEDAAIHGLLIRGSFGSGYSLANIRELRRAIERFGNRKETVAWVDYDGMLELYLKSAAEEVIGHASTVGIVAGLRAEPVYLGELLDNIGVGVQVVKTGPYKSAGDMFTERSMPEAEREQLRLLITNLWGALRATWSASRGIEPEVIDRLANEEGLLTAESLIENGLVDELLQIEEFEERLIDKSGQVGGRNTYRAISLPEYTGLSAGVLDLSVIMAGGQNIGVVYVEGTIVNGEGSEDQAGGDRVARYLRELRVDKDVKAVVLRVNSPGGGLSGSEKIANEVRLTSLEKPMVISMAGIATSGGYFVSALGDLIFAEPETITGSIGVIGILTNIEEMAEKVGANFDHVQTHDMGGFFRMTEKRSQEDLAVYERFIGNGYDRFLQTVATGRDMDIEEVRSIAGGRIWSGKDALELGLIDGMGGLRDAILRAADLAGIGNDFVVVDRPRSKTLEEALMDLFDGGFGVRSASGLTEAALDSTPLAPLGKLFSSELESFRSLNDPMQLYGLNPFQITIY